MELINDYFDANIKLIRAGQTLRHMETGDLECVEAYHVEDDLYDLGIIVSNPEFLEHHPDWPIEIASLSQFDTSEYEIISTR